MPLTKLSGIQIETPVDISAANLTGITTATDLNATRINVTGVGTISNGSITNLTGTSSTITTFTSTNGSITNLTGTSSTITTLTSTNGSITNLTGTSSTITTLRSTTGNFTTGNIVTGVTTNFNTTNVVITGVTTVSAGTALLPSISPSGDPNTGIFFPTADHLNFSTGGTSRVQIDSDGDINIDGGTVFVDAVNNRFGIGTTSPGTFLHLRTGVDENFLVSGGEGIRMQAMNDAANVINQLKIGGSPLLFLSLGGVEAARITSTGNVGIGVTSPGTKLSITGPDNSISGQLQIVATGAGADAQITLSTPLNGRGIYVDDSDVNKFKIYTGSGKGAGGEFIIDNSGNVTINGSCSKSSGSFRIPHPLKPETHQLVHSFIEGPQADLIYRGKVKLVAGRAEVNIDAVAGMTEDTFVALNREVQCFTSNESDWDAVRGLVSSNILTIDCQNTESTATVSWIVIGERHDQHMYDTDWTDENGKVIVEPLKNPEPQVQGTLMTTTYHIAQLQRDPPAGSVAGSHRQD